MSQSSSNNQQQITVFLAHNSLDKPQVKRIHEKLNQRGIGTWLDQVDLLPGQVYQDEIQRAISKSNAVAVFIGRKGLGDWQDLELKTFVSNFVKQGCPVIPVLLPGVTEVPANLSFLAQFHSVEFRQIDDLQAIENLVRGIKQSSSVAILPKRDLSERFREKSVIIIKKIFHTVWICLKYKVPLFFVVILLLTAITLIENQARIQSAMDAFTSRKPTISFRKEEPLSYKPEKLTDDTDPVKVIYQNNNNLDESIRKVTLAVSVPIGSNQIANSKIALEMLRGVAQAQEIVNQEFRNNGLGLEVAIADDENNPTLAEKVAANLSKENKILAVVGHNSSESSLAASKVYTTNKLVMISPTSDAPGLFKLSKYIFTTMSDNSYIANKLGNYIIDNIAKDKKSIRKVLICSNTQSQVSEALRRNLYVKLYSDNIIKESDIPCDFSENFNPDDIVRKSGAEKVDAIVLLPSVNDIQAALDLVAKIAGTIPLIGSPTLAMRETIDKGGRNVEGLVVAVPWAWQDKKVSDKNSFESKADGKWKGPVNWRSAMSYDATMAIVEGLKKLKEKGLLETDIRDNLANTLNDKSFTFKGATGDVGFQKVRNSEVTLLMVQGAPLKFSSDFKHIDRKTEDCN